ncbi:hypothetical protein H9658_20430 [Xanthomonas sp. Sa3BUA13]|nr:hypothetical protein [Xanthomonas surreyensis]
MSTLPAAQGWNRSATWAVPMAHRSRGNAIAQENRILRVAFARMPAEAEDARRRRWVGHGVHNACGAVRSHERQRKSPASPGFFVALFDRLDQAATVSATS